MHLKEELTTPYLRANEMSLSQLACESGIVGVLPDDTLRLWDDAPSDIASRKHMLYVFT
jgi:hypothetical protein